MRPEITKNMRCFGIAEVVVGKRDRVTVGGRPVLVHHRDDELHVAFGHGLDGVIISVAARLLVYYSDFVQ